MTPVPTTSVEVLGAVSIFVDGARVEARGRRSRELLARLVLARGDVVSTDRLVDDLWAGEAPPNALNSLQVHVSHLRRALEPTRERGRTSQVLVSAAPGYALRLPVGSVDVWRFEQLLASGDEIGDDPAARRDVLTAALACWSGPAYAEFADAAWAVADGARMEQMRRTAEEAAAAADLDLGRHGRAVSTLERLVGEDEAREESARLLALGLYRSGRQADALAVLRRLRRHLVDELGIDPGPSVRALEADILAHAPSLDARPVERAIPEPPSPPTGITPSPDPRPDEPLVPLLPVSAFGRDRESLAIARAATAAHAGAVRLVWVAGEAGDGKTTLVDWAAEQLRLAGWHTARGRCPEVEGAPPGWAWREIVEDLGLDVAALTARAATDADTTALNPFLVAHEIGAALRATAATAPCLVVLDDAHRADDLTAQLLRQVVDTLAGARVLVIVTYRPSEATPQLATARAAVAAVTVDHLQLTGLDRVAVAELANSVGLTTDERTLDLLVDRTGGNPLFVRELARLLATDGRRAGATAVPVGVADVLRARAARLPASAVAVLRNAALLGREVDVELLAAVIDRDVDEVLDDLEAPVLAGLLHHAGPDRVRFDHAIVRDTFYADTPPLRRSRWHARALTVLSARDPGAVDALAYHAMESLRPDTADVAVHWTRAAAARAMRVGAPAQAADLYRQALRAADLMVPGGVVTDGAGADGADRADAVELRADAIRAYARSGDAVGGRDLQRQAVELAGDDDHLLELVLSAWDAPLIWSVRNLNLADDVMLVGLRRLLAGPRPDARRARLQCALFLELENLDDAGALACSAEALQLARRSDDDRLLCAALNVRAYAALGPDLADQREQLAQELVEVATRAGHSDYEAAGYWLVFLSAAARGDLIAAQRAVDHAVELSVSGQLAGLLGVLNIWRAMLHVLAGRVDEGLQQYAMIAAALAEGGGANATIMDLVGRVVVGFAAGDLSGLADDLLAIGGGSVGYVTTLALLDAGRDDEARAVYAATPPVERGYYWLGLSTARALAAARLAEVGTARRCYAELRPWSGRIAGLDSGTMPLGPVDDALAACAELLGESADAAGHRRAAADTRAELAQQLSMLAATSNP